MKRGRLIFMIIAVLGSGLLVFGLREKREVRIEGIAQVKKGMTRSEVLALTGPPRKYISGVMKDGVYGVPDEIETKIGMGNAFEMWEYEKETAPKTAYATIWLQPSTGDAQGEARVVAVKTMGVSRSLHYRFLHFVARCFLNSGLDL